MGVLANLVNPQQSNQASTGPNNSAEKPKQVSKIWLNIGYTAVVTNEQGAEEEVFVALPMGIGLDTMKENNVRGSDNYAFLMAAGNGIRTQLLEVAGRLRPGESVILPGDGPLQIQIRRINEERTVDQAKNPLARQLALLG